MEGLRDHGYVEGRTIEIEWRWWQDKAERLPELAAELVETQLERGRDRRNTGCKGAQRRDPNHSDCHGSHRRSGRCWNC